MFWSFRVERERKEGREEGRKEARKEENFIS